MLQHSLFYRSHAKNGLYFVSCSKKFKEKKKKVKSLSRVRLFATPWIVAYQAPLSMGFSRQEYCSGLPFPSPGDLPHPGVKPGSPTLQADSLPSEPPGKPYSNSASLNFFICKGGTNIFLYFLNC